MNEGRESKRNLILEGTVLHVLGGLSLAFGGAVLFSPAQQTCPVDRGWFFEPRECQRWSSSGVQEATVDKRVILYGLGENRLLWACTNTCKTIKIIRFNLEHMFSPLRHRDEKWKL